MFNKQYGRYGNYIGLRVLMILVFTLAIYITNTARPITNFASVDDMAIPAIVGIVGLVVVGVIALIKPIQHYALFAIILADWALVGAYVFFAREINMLFFLGVAGTVIISGMLSLGPTLGSAHNGGVILIVGAIVFYQLDFNFNTVQRNLNLYVPGPLFLIVISIVTGIWFLFLDEENASGRKRVRQEIEESRLRLENMRERASAVADMAARLNTSLNYDHILDAAMDIGRLSVRQDPKERLVSLALMVRDEESMEIATARGLQHHEMRHIFRGQDGVVGQVMEEGQAALIDNGAADPELRKLNAFANIRTTICIPLRANYETYGVLVFGSSARDAINEDHVDTLQAIGVQATVALKNAVLYSTLRDEKERIIRIEEEGRKALVRDLHDIPTQTVSAVAMHLSTLPTIAERNPEKLKDEVENIRKMALRATEEIRHVLFTLRPLSLETQGLTVALNQLADKMQQTYKQKMEIRIDTRVERVLSQDSQGTLFYLIEEASNNARKYAEATMIQVRGTIEGNDAVIRVRDNGKGFDTESVNSNYENRGSFGMVNMHERAELINGSFDLQSTPGKGTQVTVRIPIPAGVDIPPSTEPTRPLSIKPRRTLKKQYSGPLSPDR